MGNLQRPQASLTAKNFPPCLARVKNLSLPLYFPDTTCTAVGSSGRQQFSSVLIRLQLQKHSRAHRIFEKMVETHRCVKDGENKSPKQMIDWPESI